MLIKITRIIERLPDFSSTSKSNGKPYTIYSWNCEIEGQGNYQVKTMKKEIADNFKGGSVEVKENVFNGVKSYMIDSQSSGGGYSKYSKTTYTKDEYNDLFKLALTKLGIDLITISEDNRCKLFATYFIGAKDAGVKADVQPPKASQQDQGYNINSNDIPDPYAEDDEDIPF